MANPLGLHAMVLTPDGDAAAIDGAIRTAAGIGYDLVEVPILDPTAVDAAAARTSAAAADVDLSASLGLDEATDVSSADDERVTAGVERLRTGVDAVRRMGSGWMCGILYSKLGRYEAPPTRANWDSAVEAVRTVADHAADAGVNLGVEIVNRYESNLVNTVTDGHRVLDDVGADNLWLHVDTYHVLIEEDSVADAIRIAGERLGYVHVGQNDRGALGVGTVDMPGVMRAIDDIGYEGPITFEGFSRATAAEDLADVLAIWRSPWSDGEELARDALAVLRSLTAVSA